MHPLLIHTLALALVAPQPEGRAVEQGFEDVSPLARSTRHDPKDMRHATDFEKVYELTTPDGKKVFVRVDNGIAAVFSRSDYSRSGRALFPPNMVFHIGTAKLFESDTRSEITPNQATNRLDTRVPQRRQDQPQPGQPRPAQAEPTPSPTEPEVTPVPGPPEIVTNEIYRRIRIAQLLESALGEG